MTNKDTRYINYNATLIQKMYKGGELVWEVEYDDLIEGIANISRLNGKTNFNMYVTHYNDDSSTQHIITIDEDGTGHFKYNIERPFCKYNVNDYVKKITHLPFCPVCETMGGFCYGMNNLAEIDLSTSEKFNQGISQYTSINYIFGFCHKLQTINNINWDLSNCTDKIDAFNLNLLMYITGNISNIYVSVDCHNAPLTNDSAMVFINGLATVEAQTITFKASTYSTLTEEQIAIATSKGWTVASE